MEVLELVGREENTILEESSQVGGKTGEQIVDKREMREMEEGQINEWETVSVEKAGRSPKSHDLKYGQVIIATPSRFAVLNDSRDDGEDLDQEENEEDFDDVSQEITAEEKLEDKLSGKKRGRAVLPRVSKTNHRVIPEASDHVTMKRGSRKHL